MKKLLILFLTFFSVVGAAPVFTTPVPKDVLNTPIYGGLGLPVFSAAVQLDDSTWEDLVTLPSTGANAGRPFRHICVYNPSAAANVNICFGTGCTTAQMSVPATSSGGGLCLDHVYYGVLNDTLVIRGNLSATASVTPQITAW